MPKLHCGNRRGRPEPKPQRDRPRQHHGKSVAQRTAGRLWLATNIQGVLLPRARPGGTGQVSTPINRPVHRYRASASMTMMKRLRPGCRANADRGKPPLSRRPSGAGDLAAPLSAAATDFSHNSGDHFGWSRVQHRGLFPGWRLRRVRSSVAPIVAPASQLAVRIRLSRRCGSPPVWLSPRPH